MLQNLVDTLKEIRCKEKITHEELSRRTGISQKHISNIENHKTKPSIDMLEKLAEGLGIELNIEIAPKASGE